MHVRVSKCHVIIIIFLVFKMADRGEFDLEKDLEKALSGAMSRVISRLKDKPQSRNVSEEETPPAPKQRYSIQVIKNIS